MPPKAAKEPRLSELGLPPNVLKIAELFNNIPDIDLQVVREALEGYKAELQTLQDKEAAASTTARRSTANSAVLEQRILACRSLLAPWRRLPLEIWEMIFSTCVEAARQAQKPRQTTPDYDVPGTLSRVCKSWKAIVDSIPSVWGDVSFSAEMVEDSNTAFYLIPTLRKKASPYIAKRVARVAGYAKPWSLTIRIQEADLQWRNRDLEKKKNTSLRQFLVRNREHLKSVHRLRLQTSTLAQGIDAKLRFPSVTSLVIDASQSIHASCFCCHGDPPPASLEVVPSFPKLKQAVLTHVVCLERFHQHLPWKKLTHLHLGGTIGFTNMQYMLTLCTSLECASFTSSTFTWNESPTLDMGDEDEGYPPLEKPAGRYPLKELTIVCEGNPLQHSLFEGMWFPDLTALRLYLSQRYIKETKDQVHANNMKVFRGLKMLHVIGMRKDAVETVVSAAPLVEKLVVGLQVPKLEAKPSDFEAAIAPLNLDRREHPGRLPHLQSLSLYFTRPQHWMGSEKKRETDVEGSDSCPDLVGAIASRAGDDREAATRGLKELEFTMGSSDESDRDVLNQVKADLEAVLQPVCDSSKVQLSVHVRQTEWGRRYESNIATMKHWDEGLLDFLDQPWAKEASEER